MINHTWRARLIRLWLVIGVPLACWSAYEAWDAFQKISFWDGQIESWRVRLADQEKRALTMEWLIRIKASWSLWTTELSLQSAPTT